MKASVWGLLVAAVAFGASTIYLSLQLNEERATAEKLAEATRALNARIAELEKAREPYAVSGSVVMNPAGQGSASAPPPPEAKPDAKLEASIERAGPPPPSSSPPPRREAMQKMMRAQIRANNKRMYAGIEQTLGLSKEDTSKLIDMLTDQQVANFELGRELGPLDQGTELRRRLDEANRASQAELENFLGASRMEQLRDYQQTIPARQELDALTRQLEGSDASMLNEDQQKRMLNALVEERKRIPAPKYSDSATPEEYSRVQSQWQSEYNERVNSRAQGILNSDQLTALTEYQQWQKEMRDQAMLRRQNRGERAPGSRGVPVTSVPAGESR